MSDTNYHTMFLTYGEAAKETRLSVSMIRKLTRQRALRVVKIGRAARIPRSELERLCERQVAVAAIQTRVGGGLEVH